MSDRVRAAAARTLSELQAWMLDAVCGPQRRATAGIVVDGPRLSGAERLDVYRYAYRARLRECLRDDYPVLAATLGEARFDALCDAYLVLHPSGSPSLHAFGRHLPQVCAAWPGLDAPAFCAELAALEWALVEVTHAEAPVPLDLGELQRVPAEAWSGVRLIASDAVRVLKLEYPVNAYYQAYRSDGPVPPLPAAGASATAVYRREIALWRMDLTPAMACVLGALLEGNTIAEALTQVGEGEAEGDDVMNSFRAWVEGGMFTGIVWG